MKYFEQRNVYEVLQPLFVWTKFLGLSPFVVNKDGYRSSLLSLLYTLVLLLLLSVASMYIVMQRPFDAKDGLITNVTEVLELYTSNINMIISILFCCICRHQTLNVINRIHELDTEFSSPFLAIDFKKSYQKTAVHLTVAIFAINIYLFICFLLDVYVFLEKSFFNSAMFAFVYICPKLVTSYSIVQFCYLAILLKQRFRMLNDKLEGISNILERTKNSNYPEKTRRIITSHPRTFLNERVSEAIDRMRLKHYILCDISYELNSAYSVQILFTSLQTFMTILSCLFYCINDILSSDYESSSGFIIPYTINVGVLSLWQIASVAIVCSSTKIEAKKTGRIIHKTVPTTTEKELEIELIYFSLQLLHHNVEFTACRMFPINERLLLSMIGVICTYLVIVIQFEYGLRLRPTSSTESTAGLV